MSEAVSNDVRTRLQWSLLALRLGVFIVMFVWTLDKFVNPGHSIAIFEKFYSIPGLGETVAYIMGALQLILVLHGGSTLSALGQYLDAFNNLLFFAAWPMWAACFVLYFMRDQDTKFTLGN